MSQRRRTNETPEQREERLTKRREQDRERRAKARAEETPQQKEERLTRKRSAEQRQQHRRRREAQAANETLQQSLDAYLEFLETANIPSSLEEDIFRLQQLQASQDNDQEVSQCHKLYPLKLFNKIITTNQNYKKLTKTNHLTLIHTISHNNNSLLRLAPLNVLHSLVYA